MIQTFIYKTKEKAYLYFFVKLCVFLFVLYIMDLSVGNLLNYFYFKQINGFLFRTTYSIDKSNADVVIFGTSRANHHYISTIFENRLHLSCYNVGRDGQPIYYHYAILNGILKRHTPKIIVFDFNQTQFTKSNGSYDRVSSLLPYYNSHPEIHTIIKIASPYESYKLLSKIYPFNSLILKIIIGNFQFNKNRNEQENDIKGYVPLKGIWNGPIRIDSTYNTYETDRKKIECFENFIKECKKRDIQLFIFVSPCFIKSYHSDYSVILGQKIAQTYNIMFYDYSKDTIFTSNNSLFHDVAHLNDIGATLYTNTIITKMLDGK